MNPWKWLRNLRNRSDEDDRPLPYIDPLHAGRHPFQIYMLTLCVIAGIPYLFGYASAEVVENQLPVFLATTWGLMLLFGAAFALIGSFWRGSIANGLTMERAGLGLTGGAALIYGLCIVGARSLAAPALVIGVYMGYLLLRVPINKPHWSARKTSHVSDVLTVLGVVFMVGSLTTLMFTPALVVLVGAFVILGFGLSCVTRARDIAQIFHRAIEADSMRILREDEAP